VSVVETFFAGQLALLVTAAAFMAIVGKKTHQPSLVMYILTGLALGPAGAALASLLPGVSISALVSEGVYISTMSELGLAFLLFFIGLEIKIEDIREVLGETLTVSVVQMGAIAAIFYGLSVAVGFGTVEAVVIALAFMYSSTAVVVKILADRGEVATKAGKLDVSMLLFEDVTVVLVMAVLGSLAAAGSFSLATVGFEGLKIGFFVLVVAAAAILSSKLFLPRFLRYVSESRHVFLIHGLAWMFLFVVLAQRMGLSLEVGAFFAGVSIAQLPYSSELHSRVKPLTDFFLAVFFVSLGLGLSVSDLLQYAEIAVAFSAAIVVLKFILYYSLTSKLGFGRYDSFKSSINMTQTSTFSIVYATVASNPAKGDPLIGTPIVAMITLVALLTMGSSSYLIYFSDRIYSKIFGPEEAASRESEESVAIVAGYNQAVEGVLDDVASRYGSVKLVDRRPEVAAEMEGREDIEFEFADFGHREVRSDLGIDHADLLVSFDSDLDVELEALEEAPEDCEVVYEAETRQEADTFREAGADYVFLEEAAAAEKLSDMLDKLGVAER
jgi:Kef-type K+ transport systems, membrane components